VEEEEKERRREIMLQMGRMGVGTPCSKLDTSDAFLHPSPYKA
jgi:hypothetical protein